MTKKISQLPAATSVDTNDEFVINQDGTTKKLTTANQWDFANVNIDGGTIDGTAVNATNLAYSGTLTGGTGVVNLGSGQVFKGANGFVGVGTAAPDDKLHIISTVAAGANNFALRLQNTTTATDSRVGIAFLNNSNTGASGSGATIQTSNNGVDGAGNLLFGTLLDGTNTEAMRIDSSGHVGIGTGSTLSKALTVNGGTASGFTDVLQLNSGSTANDSGPGITLNANYGNYTTLGNWQLGAIRAGAPSAALNYAGYLSFFTNGNASESSITERMRIDSSGHVSLTSGNLILSNGAGIDFSAHPNAAGMTSELLDDYEEGTFTPAIEFGTSQAGMTLVNAKGFYTKIGRLVTFTLRVSFSNKGSATGNAVIANLPFTPLNISNANAAAYFGFINNSSANWNNSLIPTIDINVTVIQLRYVNGSGNFQQFLNTDFTNTTDLIMGGHYFTA